MYGIAQQPHAVCKLATHSRRLRVFGCSSLELCYLANGVIDALVDLRGYLRMTDIAAGVLIARGAGITVTDEGGANLNGVFDIGTRLNMVAAPPPLHAEIMDILLE